MISKIVLMLILALQVQASSGSDLARGKRLADQIVDGIFVGEPMYLEVDRYKFLAIHTGPETDKSLGGVIILHGRGYHPDWEHVVHPLRTGLAERGWRTLALQMPVLGKDAKYDDYVPVFKEAFPRIEAGVKFLRGQGEKHVTIIAHSCSVHMSMAWLDQGNATPINAYVGIGMGATDYGQAMEKPFPLEKLRFPVLDIYGVDEFNAVIRAAPGRFSRISSAGNSLSRQVVLPQSEHYFEGSGDILVDAITDWLQLLN